MKNINYAEYERQLLDWLMCKPRNMSLNTGITYTNAHSIRVVNRLLAYRYKGGLFLQYKHYHADSDYIVAHAILSDLLIKLGTLFFPHTKEVRFDVELYDTWLLHAVRLVEELKRNKLQSALIELNLANNYRAVFRLNVPQLSLEMSLEELERAYMTCVGYLKLVERRVPEISEEITNDFKYK